MSTAYIGLSQLLSVHMYNWPPVFIRHCSSIVINHLCLLHSFQPLCHNESWALKGESMEHVFHIGILQSYSLHLGQLWASALITNRTFFDEGLEMHWFVYNGVIRSDFTTVFSRMIAVDSPLGPKTYIDMVSWPDNGVNYGLYLVNQPYIQSQSVWLNVRLPYQFWPGGLALPGRQLF